MFQIEIQEMANRKKKSKTYHCFPQDHSLKAGLKKFGKKDKEGERKEEK